VEANGVNPNVTWVQVREVMDRAFCIWTGSPELRWARLAWTHLANDGLTTAEDQIGHVRVHVRALVLASFYRDWCAVVWDEVHDDSPGLWLHDADVDRLHIGQLVGPDIDLSEDPDEALEEALNALMKEERPAVIAALLKGFGDVPGLFVSLWRSNKDSDSDAEGAESEGDEDEGTDEDNRTGGDTEHADESEADEEEEQEDDRYEAETDWDILNDPTEEKLAGYQWLDQGCEFIGPIRNRAEFD
jgi:hypothetical protein